MFQKLERELMKESRIKNKGFVFRNALVDYSECSDTSTVSSQSLLIMTSHEGHSGTQAETQ
jgi:hypothetical protein